MKRPLLKILTAYRVRSALCALKYSLSDSLNSSRKRQESLSRKKKMQSMQILRPLFPCLNSRTFKSTFIRTNFQLIVAKRNLSRVRQLG